MSPINFKKALKDARQRVDYWAQSAMMDFLCQLEHVLEGKDVTQSELARRLEKSPAYISKVMRGNQNLTLHSMASLAHAVGYRVEIHLIPQGEIHVAQHRHYLRNELIDQFRGAGELALTKDRPFYAAANDDARELEHSDAAA